MEKTFQTPKKITKRTHDIFLTVQEEEAQNLKGLLLHLASFQVFELNKVCSGE